MRDVIRLRKLVALLLGFVVLGAASSSCVQYSQIRDIVNESNELAALGHQATLDALPADAGADVQIVEATWKETAARLSSTVKKIDDFIASYPDQTATIQALRMRKGALYLSHGYFNLAKTSFDEADPKYLNERDLAFHAARDVLVWWYKVAPVSDRAKLPDAATFAQKRTALDKVLQAEAEPKTDARHFLMEIRTQLVWKHTRTFAEEAAEAKAALEEGLLTYAKEFTPADQAHVKAFFAKPADVDRLRQIPIGSLRWYGHVGQVVQMYKKAAGDLGVESLALPAENDWILSIEPN